MNSARIKKVLLLLGILIAFLIGINTYAEAIAQTDPVLDTTLSWVNKFKSISDVDAFIKILTHK